MCLISLDKSNDKTDEETDQRKGDDNSDTKQTLTIQIYLTSREPGNEPTDNQNGVFHTNFSKKPQWSFMQNFSKLQKGILFQN